MIEVKVAHLERSFHQGEEFVADEDPARRDHRVLILDDRDGIDGEAGDEIPSDLPHGERAVHRRYRG